MALAAYFENAAGIDEALQWLLRQNRWKDKIAGHF
jgi:hypothetical protein